MNPTGKLEASIGVENLDALEAVLAIEEEEKNRWKNIFSSRADLRLVSAQAGIVEIAIKLARLVLEEEEEEVSASPGTAPFQEV